MKRIIAPVVFCAVVLAPGLAHAKLDIFSGSVGGLFVAGANVWTRPESDMAVNLEDAPFGDTAGGYGIGGGLMLEARFIKFIGLELDLIIEHNDQWFNLEINGGMAEATFHLKYLNVRIPILVKAVIPFGIVRFSIGLGPEFVISRNDKTSIDQKRGAIIVDMSSRPQEDVALCAGMGFAFKVWKLSIPLNLRFSYNFGQPKAVSKRIRPDVSGGTLASENLVASETMDVSLHLGLAYDF